MKIRDRMEKELLTLEKNCNVRILKELDGNLINFSSNDYLSLGEDQELREELFKEYGVYSFSSSSSRLLTGSYPLIMKLEARLKSIYDREGLVFNSGSDANQCVIETIFPKDTLILSDRLNHASIYSGILATKNRFIRYNHLDYSDLEGYLIKYSNKYKNILVVTETIYSMDGDMADLEKIVELKRKYGFYLMIDEAHSYGVYGYGICHSHNLQKEVDYLVIPLGKGGGSTGAYLLSDCISKEYIVNRGKKFIYTTAPSPIITSWNLSLLEKMDSFSSRIDKLNKLTKFTHELLKKSGIPTDSTTHIISIILGDNLRCEIFCRNMREKGYLLSPIKEPTVPKGTARIRVSLTANMEFDMVKKFLEEVKSEIDTSL